MFGLILSGCSTTPARVRQGDTVSVRFTCRLPGGEVAASTRPDPSLAGEAKAPVYLPRTGLDTVSVTAGPQPAQTGKDRLPFEQEIVQRLAAMLPGLQEGGQALLDLEADRFPVSAPNEKQVRLATVRKRQKQMRLTREEYTGRTGRSPELGQPFVLDRMVPGEVSELTEKEVLIRFAPVPGQDLGTPFGPVTVRELAEHYELQIAAQPGRLIRTGAIAGRITAVDQESITIDYGHPFAGEKLSCDVKVLKVQQQGRDLAVSPPAPKGEGAAAARELPEVAQLDQNVARQLDQALRRISAGSGSGSGAEGAKAATAAKSEELH
ncbi:MAG: hypothetical protein A2075_11635 [Geobacteraceae bacterium GWC2_58_44]|nr:MAG: hypothetical protein A2075_11635 [Geobacteraceae bacterium GWC2_58_44]HBG04798.1 hypothetical protein [Geobacter sp.]